MFDTVTLCGKFVDLLPTLIDLLLSLRNLLLTDSLNTFLVKGNNSTDTRQIANSGFQHTVGIFEFISLCGKSFDICLVAVDLICLIGDFFIKRVDTALMMFCLCVQQRKKFSRLLNAGLVLLFLKLSLFSSQFFRIDRRLVGDSLIVIILYWHRLPHFVCFTMMITAAVTAVTTALPMIIIFFMV